MKRYWATSIAAMAAILALSACTIKRELPSAGDTVDLGVFVNGQPLDKFLSNPEETNKVLSELFGPGFAGDEGRDKLRELLQSLDNSRPLGGVTAFRGICGFSTAEFARAIVNPNEVRETRGLIGDYLFEFDGNYSKSKDGLKYNGMWPGHLTVDMKTETYKIVGGQKILIRNRTEILQWHIEVVQDARHDGFEVRLRQGDAKNNPNDPFPGTVVFPPESLDPTNDFSIWARGLDHKLWAKGTEIVVHDVIRWIGDLPPERLPDTHEFYRPCKESCIDMMTKGFPPVFRIDFPEQSGYCLGRCDHPFIMNSM